jgi:hypothetical protein
MSAEAGVPFRDGPGEIVEMKLAALTKVSLSSGLCLVVPNIEKAHCCCILGSATAGPSDLANNFKTFGIKSRDSSGDGFCLPSRNLT